MTPLGIRGLFQFTRTILPFNIVTVILCTCSGTVINVDQQMTCHGQTDSLSSLVSPIVVIGGPLPILVCPNTEHV